MGLSEVLIYKKSALEIDSYLDNTFNISGKDLFDSHASDVLEFLIKQNLVEDDRL